MTVLQAAAALTLWRSGQFDTVDIAFVLRLHESEIVIALDAVRERERRARPIIVHDSDHHQPGGAA